MLSRILDEKQIAKAKALIERAERILVVSHMTPDGDAVGSSLAVMHVFSALGKNVKILVPDGCLLALRTLPGAKEIVEGAAYPEFAAKLFDMCDLVLCLDFNQSSRISRLEPLLEANKAPKILIDHHLEPTVDADVVISRPDMSSTCYLLFRVFCRLELFNLIDKNAATCLLAGMMTDTGNFAYNCDDPELYTVVAELVRKGANKEKLYRDLFNTFTADCMKLNAYAIYKKMEVFPDYGAAMITLTREELNRFHYAKGDTEGLVNRPLSIPGIHYTVFLREERDCIHVSMRSVGDFPVNEVCAAHFGGGGHKNAAGGEYTGTIEEAAKYFRSLLKENKDKYLKKNK